MKRAQGLELLGEQGEALGEGREVFAHEEGIPGSVPSLLHWGMAIGTHAAG